jgi:hypothetical protein
MPSSIEWINKCLTISAHPAKKAIKDNWWNDFDLIINLSDHIDHRLHSQISSQGIPIYWFPMGETYGMPLENIFGALSILWEAEKKYQTVLMHCMAGRNRSVTIADCYYFIRQGKHRADNSGDVLYGKNKSNKLLLNIDDNQLPGIFRMERFLEKCQELLENPKIADNAYIDWLKKETFGY